MSKILSNSINVITKTTLNAYIWIISGYCLLNALSSATKINPFLLPILLAALIITIISVKRLKTISTNDTQIKVAMGISILLTLGYFLISFPIWEFNSIVFHIDFTQFYTLSLIGINSLLHGSVFGWNSGLLGGYNTIADMNNNYAFFMLPFMLFGSKIAFHLMLLSFTLAFTPLMWYWIKIKSSDKNTQLYSIILSTGFVFYYFRLAFHTGTIDWFMAPVFLIVSLIFNEFLLNGKKFSVFFLAMSLSLLFYLHMGIFLSAIIAVLANTLLAKPSRATMLKLFTSFIFAGIFTLHFIYYYLFHPGYIVLEHSNFSPINALYFPLISYLLSILSELIRLASLSFPPHDINGLVFLFIPAIFVFKDRIPEAKKYYILLIIVFLISFISNRTLALLISRVTYLFPIFIIPVAVYLIKSLEKNHKYAAVILLLCFPIMITPVPEHFPHIKSFSSYNKPLFDKIKTMDGNMILLESRVVWQVLPSSYTEQNQKDPLKIHPESLIQLETEKKLFSGYAEGYHHSIFRGNTIMSGTFNGAYVNEYPISKYDSLLKKWGIHYLVLWSDRSIGLFSIHPDRYRPVWNDKNWQIFEYLYSDTRSVAVKPGTGQLLDKDPFIKIIKLNNVPKNTEVVIRSNYLKDWNAYYNGKKIPLYNVDGQIGFKSPSYGTYSITLKYPKFGHISAFILFSISLLLVLSYKNYI